MKKNNNQIGNPYHDEDGKFTSSNDTSSKNVKDESMPLRIKAKIKPGVNLSDLIQALQKTTQQPQKSDIDTSFSLTMPQSIQDAEMQGNRIIGSNGSVGYKDDTDLAVCHEFNKALFSVCSDFPEFFNNEQLYLYGTANKRKEEYNEQKIIGDVLAKPIYVQKMQQLGVNKDNIMDIMVESFQKVKLSFNDDPKRSVGGFTDLTDLSRRRHTLNTNNIIKFNTHYSRSGEKWEDYASNAISTRHFLPIGNKTTAYMVATHELGHHVFEKLIDLMNNEQKATLKALINDDSGGDYERLFYNGKISYYATSNRHEHIAECFANWYCMNDQATKHNQNLFKFLKQTYDEIFSR